MSDARVVLIKPGDVLVIGNTGVLENPCLAIFGPIKDALGLAGVVIFEGDIDLAAVTPPTTASA